MSDLAERRRRGRRAWAAAGSGHDRVVGSLRILLPLAIGTLAAFLAFAPLTLGRNLSFILSKDRVEVAGERLRVARAVYRGQDDRGQPFRLSAASAVQASSRDPVVRLAGLDGRIELAEGPAGVTAPAGRYDMDRGQVAFDGPVRFRSADGYRVDTSDVTLDMATKALASRGAVTGGLPIGRFSADRMRANLDARTVVLDGRTRLHIVQARRRTVR